MDVLPVLALKEQVAFPGNLLPVMVGRPKSRACIRHAEANDRRLILITQKVTKEDLEKDDLFSVGVIATIQQKMDIPDGSIKLVLKVEQRVQITELIFGKEAILAKFELKPDLVRLGPQTEAYIRQIKKNFEIYAAFIPREVGPDLAKKVLSLTDATQLVDTIANLLTHKSTKDKQKLLEATDSNDRLELLLQFLVTEVEVMKLEQDIQRKVKQHFDKHQRSTVLNEQINQIRREMGDDVEDEVGDLRDLEKQLRAKVMPKAAKERAMKELRKLKQTPVQSAEASVLRNYLDLLVTLPWGKYQDVRFDYDESLAVLEARHYGLEKIKERVLEFLSVQQLTGGAKGVILCFVGPPGVGKSSLSKSIAEATGRKFVKASLGGVRDEAEIRGHRRTYVGAMPGKIVAALKKCEFGNPVFLLDEVDKVTKDTFRGDVSAALLEVLDPDHNHEFQDHYLDIDYDLSKILFIATANTLETIPAPLLDRMEIIELSSYTLEEKFHIAKNYLLPKQVLEHGLPVGSITLSDATLKDVIRFWTREAGVRNLSRELGRICRKVATEVVRKKPGATKQKVLSSTMLLKYLGAPKYDRVTYQRRSEVGVVNGLAYTAVGGTLLTVEMDKIRGKGKFTFTGRLGEVMTESTKTAMSCVQCMLEKQGWDSSVMDTSNYHIHFPEGAIPKDGPSAGIAIATAFFSVVTDSAVRSDVAMTGEITLKGQVLAIGGLKEKLTAAYKEGMKQVIIPKANEADLEEALTDETKTMQIHCVEKFEDVLKIALTDTWGTVVQGITMPPTKVSAEPLLS